MTQISLLDGDFQGTCPSYSIWLPPEIHLSLHGSNMLCRSIDILAHNTKLCTDSGLLANRNSLIGQIMHYSRIMHVDNGRYFPSTAVFLSEVSKFGFCVIVVVGAFIKRKSKEGHPWSWKNLWSEMFGGDAWKLSVPAALYTVASGSSMLTSCLASE